MSCPAHFQLVRHFDWYVYDVAGFQRFCFTAVNRSTANFAGFHRFRLDHGSAHNQCGFAVLDNPEAHLGLVNFGAAIAFATSNAPVMVSVSADRLPAEFLDRVAPPTEQNRRGAEARGNLPVASNTRNKESDLIGQSRNLQGRRSISEMIL
jgi:hypothetical protein